MELFNKIKNSQISIFLIISAIIVIGGVSSLVFFSEEVAIFSDKRNTDPIINYVESCIKDVTLEGQKMIAFYGGHLYTKLNSNEFSNIKTSSPNQIKKSKGMNILGKMNMEYSHYFDENTNSFIENFPTYDDKTDKNSIRAQLITYVYKNINQNCLRNFFPFKKNFEIKTEKLKINMKLENEFIIVKLEYPISIKDKSTKEERFLEDFVIKVENKIVVPYYMAKSIINNEKTNHFFETKVFSILGSYSNIYDREGLPPKLDYAVDFDKRPWIAMKLEKKTKEILNVNLPIITFENTRELETYYFPEKFSDNDYISGLISSYKLKNFGNEIDSINSYAYDEFENYQIKPTFEIFFPSFISYSKNSIITPEVKSPILEIIPIHTTIYKSNWDLTIPILFEIKNPYIKDSLEFRVLIETNIKNNLPLSISSTFISNSIKQSSSGNSETLICNDILFVGNYTLELNDTTSNKGVEGAIVTFNCKGIETCYLGKTQTNKNTQKTKINFQLPPSCFPGTLEITKENHKKIIIENLDPKLNKNTNLGIYDFPSKKKIQITIPNLNFQNKEEAFIIFKNKEDESLIQIAKIDKDTKEVFINIIPNSEYLITGKIITNKAIIIPEEEKCKDKKVLGVKVGETCFKIPKIELDSFIVGNYNYTTKFTVSQIQKDKIEIDISKLNSPTNFDEFQSFTNDMNNLKSTKPRFY